MSQDIVVKESKDSLKQKVQKKRLKEEHRQLLKRRYIQFSKNYCINWIYTNISDDIEVSLDHNAMVFRNKNKFGDWKTVKTYYNYGFNGGKHYFEIEILNMSDNDSDVLIGIVENNKKWNKPNYHIGNDGSIAYDVKKAQILSCGEVVDIADDISGKTLDKGDRLGILLDYTDENKPTNIIFFKNGEVITTCYVKQCWNVSPAISTFDYKSEFRLIVPDEDELLNRDCFKNISDELVKSYRETQDHIRDISYKMSDDYICKLIKCIDSTGYYVWDPKSALQDNINMEFDEDCTKFVNKDGYINYYYNDKPKYIKTLNIIESGVAFIEFEIENINNRLSIGVIDKNNQYWIYKSAGEKKKSSSGGYGDYYGEEYSSGDKIALYLDLDEGTLEFFKNGITQDVAFVNVVGPVNFCVVSSNYSDSVKIIPSTFDTYIEYSTRDLMSYDGWDKGSMSGFNLISDNTIEINANDITMKARGKKRFSAGRRYFELTCNNVKGAFKFGIARSKLDYKYTVTVDFGDELVENAKIGVVIDFDDYNVEVYKDGELVDTYKSESKFRIAYGYIEGINSICAGQFTINEKAEREMMEGMCLYF
jgi:hypothetical protein